MPVVHAVKLNYYARKVHAENFAKTMARHRAAITADDLTAVIAVPQNDAPPSIFMVYRGGHGAYRSSGQLPVRCSEKKVSSLCREFIKSARRAMRKAKAHPRKELTDTQKSKLMRKGWRKRKKTEHQSHPIVSRPDVDIEVRGEWDSRDPSKNGVRIAGGASSASGSFQRTGEMG